MASYYGCDRWGWYDVLPIVGMTYHAIDLGFGWRFYERDVFCLSSSINDCFEPKFCLGLVRSDDDVIIWKYFPHYWPFVQEIHQSLIVYSPHKGQWHRALIFSLICTWTNGWVNNRDAGDLRCHRAHYDITVMCCHDICNILTQMDSYLPSFNKYIE